MEKFISFEHQHQHDNFSNDPNYMDKTYKIMEELGSGGFGKVKLAVHILTGEKVAIKIIDKKAVANDLPRVTCELEALKKLAHQNICRMFQYVETEEKFYIVMEYCNGGEMFDYIIRKERLGESEARHFFRQLVQAVAYIHSMGFAHRDLKPENLLLTQDLQLKVIDFGLCAKPLNGLSRPLETCCGSPAYAAPELIQNCSYFGNEADIWSMGVLLYALLSGNLPFDDANMSRLYRKIMSGVYVEPQFLSPLCKEYLRSMLTVDPRKRANIQQLLSHPWLNKNYEQQLKWQTIYNREIIDEDILRELVYFYRTSMEVMRQKIKEWRFDNLTTTYLILLQKKERKQNYALPLSSYCGAKMPCSPTIHASLDNDLDLSYLDIATNGTSVYHSVVPQMEALTMFTQPHIFVHSPQRIAIANNQPQQSTLTANNDEMIAPCINLRHQQLQRPITAPTSSNNRCPQIQQRNNYANETDSANPRPKSVYTTPRRGQNPPIIGAFISPALYRRPNSAERSTHTGDTSSNACTKTPTGNNWQNGQATITKTPVRSNSSDQPINSNGVNTNAPSGSTSPLLATPSSNERRARIDSVKSPSRLRQRVFSSLERKADKMINLLTPKKIRTDGPTRLKCIKTMVNVSVTSSTDASQVLNELWKVLRNQGLETTLNGWKISGSKKSATGSTTTVELEVVIIEGLQYVGVKRKRIQGDAFMYKRICEEVLRLAGL